MMIKLLRVLPEGLYDFNFKFHSKHLLIIQLRLEIL